MPPVSDSIQDTFGRNIKQRRLNRGLTQEQLAEKACVSVDTIKRYESGKFEGIRLDISCYIAGALGTPLQSLLPAQNCSTEQLLLEAEALIRTARELCKTE